MRCIWTPIRWPAAAAVLLCTTFAVNAAARQVQDRGTRAGAYVAALRALDLSAEQRAKVWVAIAAFEDAGDTSPAARKSLRQKLDALLTPEQRSALHARLGTPASNPPSAPGAAPVKPRVVTEKGTPEELARYRKAAEYSVRSAGLSFLVMKDGQVVYERYDDGFTPETPHQLASGTKSFWGVLAAAAVDDGLLTSFDEKVCDTLTEWKADPRKSRITVRHLLSFTSGLQPTDQLFRNREVTDRYAFCATRPAVAEPGAVYRYSDVHLYTFGELLKRKLAARAKGTGKPAEDPLAYLKRRIFDPIGLEAGRWAHDAAGNPALPYGANLPAREWAKFGRLLAQGGVWDGKPVVSKVLLDECWKGSKANPAYGLTFWLNRPAASGTQAAAVADTGGLGRFGGRRGDVNLISVSGITRAAGERDVFMAAGAGQQRMYVLPSRGLVVVRQANKGLAQQMMRDGGASTRRELSDDELLRILLGSAPEP